MWLVLLVLGTVQGKCPVYECGSGVGSCGVYIQSNKTFTLNSCDASQYCPVPSSSANTTCQSIPPASGHSYPGEICNSTFPCISQLSCSNNRCSSPPLDGDCVANFQCGVSQYCGNSGECEDLVPVGGQCTSDYDCVQNAGCDVSISMTSGVCVRYLSKPAGSQIASCVSGYSLLCESSSCHESENGGTCMSLVTSPSALPVTCSQNSMCTSTTDAATNSTLTAMCTCGFTSSATAYCPVFPGDPAGVQYLTLLSNWTQSDAILKCHTQRRMDVYCMFSQWDTKDYLEYLVAYYGMSMYPLIQSNPSCVKDVYTTSYWAAVAADNNYTDSTDTSLSLLLPLLSLIL